MSRLALAIPARNARDVLPRLLESVRAQTVEFDDVLLYDDDSTDDTGALARRWGARVVRSGRNTGPSHGKNVLARETDCEWIHFHDADEALAPEFVARAKHWMTRPAVDVVLFGTEDRDDLTGGFWHSTVWQDAALQQDAVRYAIEHTITNCGVYRRARFLDAGGFDEDDKVKYNEDQAMHLRLALAGLSFRADPYVGVIVYRRAGSMSAAHPVECASAQVEVLSQVAGRTGSRYRREIGARAWQLAAVCGSLSAWPSARAALAVARSVGYRWPHREHWLVRLAGVVSPWWTVYGRERYVRAFKPQLRTASSGRAMRGVGSEPNRAER